MKNINQMTEGEKNNLEKAIKDSDEEILKCEEEVTELKECLESIELNYYKKRIEKNIVKFLKFHLDNVEDLIIQRKCEKDGYESALKENQSCT